MLDAWIYDAVRTPRGRAAKGSLVDLRPVDLVGKLLRALEDRGLDPHLVQDVVLGVNTVTGDQGADIARTAAIAAGWPDDASGGVVSRLCCSGLDAIATVASRVTSGMHSIALAGGVESMSRAPMMSDQGPLFADPDVAARSGFIPIGAAADLVAHLAGLGRDELDDYGYRSQQLASAAAERGAFDRSLVPVTGTDDTAGLDHDEAVRGQMTPQQFADLDPAFGDPTGAVQAAIDKRLPGTGRVEPVHTVATAPQMVDAAALVVVGSGAAGDVLGMRPRGRIIGLGDAGVRSPLLTAARPATQRALAMAGLDANQIDLWEINESFAATVLWLQRELAVPNERLNVNGGAIAMGHPLGATGGILTMTLLDELESRGQRYGAATIPAATGIASTLILERTS